MPATNVSNARSRLHTLGFRGNNLQQEVAAFQRANGLPVSGRLTTETSAAITAQIQSLQYADTSRMTQYPGFPLTPGTRDV